MKNEDEGIRSVREVREKISAEFDGTTLRSRTRDVFPIASRTSMFMTNTALCRNVRALAFWLHTDPNNQGNITQRGTTTHDQRHWR